MALTISQEGRDFSTFITAKTQMNLYHPFHIKSTWNPPVQPSAVALESYLEDKRLKPKNNLNPAKCDVLKT